MMKELRTTICGSTGAREFGFCKNKSDISYLKTSQAFDVLIHSGKPNSVG